MNYLLEHLELATTMFVTLVMISYILRSKKPAGSTMAWIIFIIVLPYVGIILYLMLGGRKIPARNKNPLFGKSTGNTLAYENSGIGRILSVSRMPRRTSNVSIDLVTSGTVCYDRYLKLINEARKSIHITTFILAKDPVGEAVIEAMTRRCSEGVQVKIIVDSLSALLLRQPSLRRFKRAGGQVAYFMPLLHLPFKGRFNLRNHRKLLVVDDQFALLGGMNLAEEYMGPQENPNRWADLAVQIEGSAVQDLQDIFVEDWNYSNKNSNKSTEASGGMPGVQRDSGTEHVAQVIASGPDVVGDPLYDVLLTSIHSAQRSLQIVTPYFIPDETLAKALELAAKRGVHVQVLTPRKSNHPLADIARGSFIRQLGAAGVEFWFYKKMIHAKAVVFDHEMALLGSANFDMRSLMLNYELGVLIYDSGIINQLSEWVDACVVQSGKGYPLENWPRQISEGIGRVFGPYI